MRGARNPGFEGGRKLRQKDRATPVSRAESSAKELIAKHAPGLCDQPPDVTEFEKEMTAVLAALQSTSTCARDAKIGRDYLRRYLKPVNAKFGLELPLPTPLVKAIGTRLLRREHWSRQRRTMNEAHAAWLSNIGNIKPIHLDAEQSLGGVLYSAATFGGLCETGGLLALAETIQRPKPLMSSKRHKLVWLDLYYDRKDLANVTVNGESRYVRRWFPPSMSLLSILHFLREPREPMVATEADCAAYLANYYHMISGQKFPFEKLSDFARVAVCVAERQPNVRLKEEQVEYALGRLTSVSMSPESFSSLLMDSPGEIDA